MYLIFDIFKQWLKLNYVKSRNTLHGPGLNHRRIGQNKHFAQISATTGAKNKHFPAVDYKNKNFTRRLSVCNSIWFYWSLTRVSLSTGRNTYIK